MKAYFTDPDEWRTAIAAAVRGGLTFEAYSREMNASRGGSGFYTIEYLGGY